MKTCPLCRISPQWHYCRNVSRARKADFFSIEGCDHAMAFAKPVGFVPTLERETFSTQWDAEAERIFAAYTNTWTDPQRVGFRVRLGWDKPTTELPLQTVEQVQAVKAWSDQHPASAEDF